MPELFRFLDQVDALLDGPASLLTSVRAAVLPGGDRPVTRAFDASRIPEADVRRHVTDVALCVLRERLRPGLVAALEEHLAAVREEAREEFTMIEGEVAEANRLAWFEASERAAAGSLAGGDLGPLVVTVEAALGELAAVEKLADAVLAVPPDNPGAVLARAGVTPGAVDALVAEIRKSARVAEITERSIERFPAINAALKRAEDAEIEDDVTCSEEPWSLARLADQVRYAALMQGEDVAREAVTYVLAEPDLLATGAEILGLDGDASFLEWIRDCVTTSTAEDAADVETVMKLALEGGDDSDGPGQPTAHETPETAAGGDEGAPPAARVMNQVPFATYEGATPIADSIARTPKPAPAEASDLTRAVGAALAALYDHGCETDKAMAEALGVQKNVVNASRHAKSPWAPESATVRQLYDMISAHEGALARARDGLEAFT